MTDTSTTSTAWQLARGAAERYEQILVPSILGPFAIALVDAAPLRTGNAVLDVGCGTGAATRRAAERVGSDGSVVGVDVNAGMLEVARATEGRGGARIEWRQGDAHELPVEDTSFDVVLCAQTLQFLAGRAQAVSEMRRALRPGGRLGVSVWQPLEQNPYFHSLVAAMTRHVGADVARGLGAAFALTDPLEVEALLVAAGLGNVEARGAELELPLPPPAEFVPRHVSATPMAAGFSAASEAARQAVVADVERDMRAFGAPAGVRVPFRSTFVFAERV